MACGFSAKAQSSLTFAWDAVDTPGVGYRLYQGTASRSYTKTIDAGANTQVTASNLTPGVKYYFSVVAYTSTTQSDYSTEIAYTPTNSLAPSIALTSPLPGASFTAPATINIAAGVSANGHTISKVQFYNGAALLGEDTTAPYSLTLNTLSAGALNLSARLVYDGSLTLNSAAVGVTVLAARPPGGGISLAVSDGTIASPFVVTNGVLYQTSQTTTPSSGGRASFPFSITTPGLYTVSATVNAPDDGANSFFVNVDTEPTTDNVWNIPVYSGFTNRPVTWGTSATPQTFQLAAGPHQLIIRGREAYALLNAITIAPAGVMLKLAFSGGLAVVTGSGQVGHVYSVQASADLKTWTTLGTSTADQNGTLSYLDANASKYKSRYYRVQDTTP
ncbi:MAG TPA: Ig-like domain-containing protein [Verrucomicrobiae bacterium]|nr:Ig-like domain-containing protein [Verrucomicrobiae bacterium]